MDNDNVVKVGMAELSALKHPGVLLPWTWFMCRNSIMIE